MGALEAGRDYLQQVLAKLPETHRAQAEAVFTAAEAAAAVSVLGEGVLRQQDYSRSMDTVRAEQQRATELYNQNKAWYDQNSADLQSLPQLLSEVERLRALEGNPAPKPGSTTPPTAPAAGYITVESAQDMARELLAMTVVMPDVMESHRERFGVRLSRDEAARIIADAQTHRRTVDQQYAITYADKIAARDTELKAAEVKRIGDEAVANFQRANPNMPYPVRPTGSSPLDALTTKIDPAELSPEALGQAYNALVASKV